MTPKHLELRGRTERRFVSASADPRIDLRAAADGGKIGGHFAVFNTWADIGGMFREQIAPGAFAETIQRDDIRALMNHSPDLVLGRSIRGRGTLALREDEVGLGGEIDPPATSYAEDLKVVMMRGDVDQASFGFMVIDQATDVRDGVLHRTLERVQLLDVSVVTYPAYASTKLAVRSALSRLEGGPEVDRVILAVAKATHGIELDRADRDALHAAAEELRAIAGGEAPAAPLAERNIDPLAVQQRRLRLLELTSRTA